MGFWSTLGKIATEAGKGLVEEGKKINELKQKMGGYSDDKLFKIVSDDSYFGGPSAMEKNVATSILVNERDFPAEFVRGQRK